MYELGAYIPVQSPLHRRDPRVKILAVLALSIASLQGHLYALALISALILAASRWGRIPLTALLKTMRPVAPFFALLFLLSALFTPGEYLLQWHFIHPSYEGLRQGLVQVWRFSLLILAASILTFTSSLMEITMAVERLLSPLNILGFSSFDLALMLGLALRFIPALIREKDAIREAQAARGADWAQGSLRQRMGRASNLVIRLSLNMIHRSDELVDALEARAYHHGPKTYPRELVVDGSDYALLFFTLTGLALAVIWPL